MIKTAFATFHDNTCIRFRKRKNEVDFINFKNEAKEWCKVKTGLVGGEQVLNLETPGCFDKLGTVVHELMHAIGMHHEHNRFDRDQFIIVVKKNIKPGKEQNFDKNDNTTSSVFGLPYDFGSVMHYSRGADAKKSGLFTIVPKVSTTKSNFCLPVLSYFAITFQIITREEIGQRNGMSKLDIEKVNKMYNC
jgi:Astacin (Peptidase family M12A)